MTYLLAQIIWGSIGFSYLMYARKQKKAIPLVVGIAMMVMPYIFGDLLFTSLINITMMFYPKVIKSSH